ncbi:glycoside hydrolase family 15 protein [Paraburkholderia sp. PGU19]|uniref:glycoside hydrolase family 15 protein n=1 Tax=Paraburkholderia sp. PGU19 TaxID=2735434 RepID=UPI0015DA9A1E
MASSRKLKAVTLINGALYVPMLGIVLFFPRHTDDGLGEGEGAFLACSFWLADNLFLQGRRDEARTLFERLLGLRNDVGLLSEEYDVHSRRLVGNFPQAFSHIALVNTGLTLTRGHARAGASGNNIHANGND